VRLCARADWFIFLLVTRSALIIKVCILVSNFVNFTNTEGMIKMKFDYDDSSGLVNVTVVQGLVRAS